MAVDFGQTAADYARYRAGFPESFFKHLIELGIATGDQAILDLGTGTGALALEFAARGNHVVALDPSPELLAQAQARAEALGLAVDFALASAEETGQPDHAFDVVAAATCWHWFDRPRAAEECARALKPGGRLLIAAMDWHIIPGNVLESSARLISEHNPDWASGGGHGFDPNWGWELLEHGFSIESAFAYVEAVPYSHEAWRGRIRASAGVAASLSPEKVAAFDAEHAQLLAEQFPSDPLAVEHRISAVLARLTGRKRESG